MKHKLEISRNENEMNNKKEFMKLQHYKIIINIIQSNMNPNISNRCVIISLVFHISGSSILEAIKLSLELLD